MQGSAETWESQAFFSQEELQLTLQSAAPLTESERAEIEQIWLDRELRIGHDLPRVDVDHVAQLLADHYGLSL